jgi:hypothetical protein
MIAGALLLQLMLAGREQSERLADIDRLSGEDALYTQSELDARIAEAEARVRRQYEQAAAGGGEAEADRADDRPADDGAGESGAPSAAGGGASPEASDGQAGTADDGAGESGAPSAAGGGASPEASGGQAGAANGATAGGIDVRIKPGMTLTETARLLESKGVIDDADALMKLMARMSTRIRAGYYSFTGNETLEDVRTIITSPPED